MKSAFQMMCEAVNREYALDCARMLRQNEKRPTPYLGLPVVETFREYNPLDYINSPEDLSLFIKAWEDELSQCSKFYTQPARREGDWITIRAVPAYFWLGVEAEGLRD